MKTIIFVDYERIIQPFIQTNIEFAKRYCDKIYFITNTLNQAHSKIIQNDEKVTIIEISNHIRRKQYIAAILAPFTLDFWKQIRASGFRKGLIKTLLKEIAVIYGLSQILNPIVKKEIEQHNNVTLIASWFTAIAVTVAKLKKKNPEINAHSFAHAFDIDPNRNVFRNRAWTEFKHKWLDGVHFVSKIKLQEYYLSLSDLKIKERFGNRISVSYLGASNNSTTLNPFPEEGSPFHIVTCSRTSPEKRLERLVDTLSMWNNGSLIWTHIGSGPLDSDLRNLIQSLQIKNPLIKVTLKGYLTNDLVKEWYTKNAVDLFINVSDTEGLPVSIMEAASFGIPCAATNVGGTCELITSKMGWLEPADFNASNFLKRLTAFANLSGEQKKLFRTEARNVWANKFNAEITRSSFYNTILKN